MSRTKILKGVFWGAVVLTLLLFCAVFYRSNPDLGLRDISSEETSYGEKDPALNQEPEEPPCVTLCGVGDVMLARGVDRFIKKEGPDYPLRILGPELAGSDLTFGNLESPIAKSGQPLPGKQICFRARPEAIETLKIAGFDLVSLANNHAVDYDSPALLETIDRLSGVGIAVVGAGPNIQEAREAVILTRQGLKVAFLAYSDLADIFFSYQYPRAHQAKENLPGVAPMCLPEILEDVKAVRNQVDAVVVSLHWGTEYKADPNPEQREMAHCLIENGVDLILGHHPHWLQGVEVYGAGVIAYSLGNFVFDQNWSEATQEGLILKAEIGPTGLKQAFIKPIYIPACQPQWASGARGDKIFKQVMERSAALDTIVEREGDWAKVSLRPEPVPKSF